MPHFLKFVPRAKLNCPGGGGYTDSYALNNMAFRFTDASGEVHSADTLDEYQQLVRAFGKAGGGAPAPKRAAPAPAASQVWQRPAPTGGGRGDTSAYTRPATPGRGRRAQPSKSVLDIHVSSMAKAVGQALGGMESYCPGRRPAKESGEKLGHITTLGELGLSENQIKEFGLMLLAEGLLVEKEGVAAGTGRPFLVLHPVGGTSFSAQSDASKVAAAKRILAEHFNVSCPGMAKSNRGRFR